MDELSDSRLDEEAPHTGHLPDSMIPKPACVQYLGERSTVDGKGYCVGLYWTIRHTDLF